MVAAQQQEMVAKAGDGRDVGRAGEAAALAAALAALQHLDAGALQKRWRTLIGGAPPKGLGRPLTLHLLAYKLQAERLGDLDKGCRRELEAVLGGTRRKTADRDPSADAASSVVVPVAADIGRAPCSARNVRSGTVLMRGHGGVQHWAMFRDAGFGWNGRRYDSLSQVAFAITGTRWNGPRFFGLREKAAKGEGTDAGRALPVGEQRGRGSRRLRSPTELPS